jgi:hypothetical protein
MSTALLVAGLVVLAGCATNTVTSQVVTTASETAPTRLPDLETPAELEETLVTFGECVEESFPIVLRFRAETFIGVTTEIGSQHEADGDQVDAVASDCNARLDLDRRIGAYQGAHPISQSDQQRLADDFVSCASAVSPEVSDLVSRAEPTSYNSVMRFISELHPPDSALTGDELVAVSGCMDDMTGPEVVFSDGYPWFTP